MTGISSRGGAKAVDGVGDGFAAFVEVLGVGDVTAETTGAVPHVAIRPARTIGPIRDLTPSVNEAGRCGASEFAPANCYGSKLASAASHASSEATTPRLTSSSAGLSIFCVDTAKRMSPSQRVWNGWIARAIDECTCRASERS